MPCFDSSFQVTCKVDKAFQFAWHICNCSLKKDRKKILWITKPCIVQVYIVQRQTKRCNLINMYHNVFYLCVSQVKGVELGQRRKLPTENEAKNILNINKYSQIFTNSHFSATTTPQQQPFFWVDSAYIHSDLFHPLYNGHFLLPPLR